MPEDHIAEKSKFKEKLEQIKPRTKFAKYAILGELLFIFLPLIVIAIVPQPFQGEKTYNQKP